MTKLPSPGLTVPIFVAESLEYPFLSGDIHLSPRISGYTWVYVATVRNIYLCLEISIYLQISIYIGDFKSLCDSLL